MSNRLLVTFLCVAMLSLPGSSLAARLATFQFEAVLENAGIADSLSIPLGTSVIGTYQFDLDTPESSFPRRELTAFSRYTDAIRSFRFRMEGFGTGNGSGGEIQIGAPFASRSGITRDWYNAVTPVSGISLPTSQNGTRNLVNAAIRLQDIDQQGISTESLLPTPPDLEFFLDNPSPFNDRDLALLLLSFDFESGGSGSIPFRLRSLTAIPEPATAILLLVAAYSFLGVIGRRC